MVTAETAVKSRRIKRILASPGGWVSPGAFFVRRIEPLALIDGDVLPFTFAEVNLTRTHDS